MLIQARQMQYCGSLAGDILYSLLHGKRLKMKTLAQPVAVVALYLRSQESFAISWFPNVIDPLLIKIMYFGRVTPTLVNLTVC
jgi:hypothetical protein